MPLGSQIIATRFLFPYNNLKVTHRDDLVTIL